MDEAITQYLKRKYNLLVGERTAENIKIQIGSAYPFDEPRKMDIKGRDLVDGIPKTLTINDSDIREALHDPIYAIVDAVKIALERTPPELAVDIAEKGIILAGGGSLLHGLDTLLALETHLKVRVADDPPSCLVLGTGKVLDELDLLRTVCLETQVARTDVRVSPRASPCDRGICADRARVGCPRYLSFAGKVGSECDSRICQERKPVYFVV